MSGWLKRRAARKEKEEQYHTSTEYFAQVEPAPTTPGRPSYLNLHPADGIIDSEEESGANPLFCGPSEPRDAAYYPMRPTGDLSDSSGDSTGEAPGSPSPFFLRGPSEAAHPPNNPIFSRRQSEPADAPRRPLPTFSSGAPNGYSRGVQVERAATTAMAPDIAASERELSHSKAIEELARRLHEETSLRVQALKEAMEAKKDAERRLAAAQEEAARRLAAAKEDASELRRHLATSCANCEDQIARLAAAEIDRQRLLTSVRHLSGDKVELQWKQAVAEQRLTRLKQDRTARLAAAETERQCLLTSVRHLSGEKAELQRKQEVMAQELTTLRQCMQELREVQPPRQPVNRPAQAEEQQRASAADWLADDCNSKQLELLASIANTSIVSFGMSSPTAAQFIVGSSAADKVLLDAFNVGRLTERRPVTTDVIRGEGDIKKAQYAVHPDKFQAAPDFVALLSGKAAQVATVAAGFTSLRLGLA